MAKYRDILLLGDGGNGEVFRCQRLSDGKCFAKKRLKDAADFGAIRRFQREVRILAQLDHPNIVKIEATHLDTDPYWFVMPLYRKSLADCLGDYVGNAERIWKVFTAILDGVAHAHDEGVIHRDLKPGNILLNSDDEIVVTDFGLGRAIDSASTRQTGSGHYMGTLHYMPPEQWNDSKNADQRSDIYSLGRILYELMGGQITARQDSSRMDSAIAAIVEKCTQTDPLSRFSSVRELKLACELAFGNQATGSDSDELARLSTRVLAGNHTDDDIDKIFAILERHSADDDLLHKTLIALPGQALGRYSLVKLDRARALVGRFVKHIESQSWPFSHTDSIGDACERMHGQVGDAHIRAQLLVCLIGLGATHNRWRVMNVSEKLLNAPRTPAERIEFANAIRGAHIQAKNWVKERFSPAQRDKMLEDALNS